MIKRVSLVRKRPGLTDREFAETWLGEHADVARRLPGLREYVVDFVRDPTPGGPDGIATVRFDTRDACDAAFATPGFHDDLLRTRADFAESVDVFFVDEHVVYLDEQESLR